MAIRWRERAIIPAPPVSEQRLAEVEHRLGVTFPEDYLEVIRTRQGAAPDRNVVQLPDGTATTFSMLLHVEDQPDGLDLLGITEDSDFLPDKVSRSPPIQATTTSASTTARPRPTRRWCSWPPTSRIRSRRRSRAASPS